jgi:hypothetical protein
MLRACTCVCFVFVPRRWALALLDASKPGRLVSLKNDLVPFLIRRQLRDPAPAPVAAPGRSGLSPSGVSAHDRRAERAIAARGSGDASARARAGLLPNPPPLPPTDATTTGGKGGGGKGGVSPNASPTFAPLAAAAGAGGGVAPLVLGGGGVGDFRSSSPGGDFRAHSPLPGADGSGSWLAHGDGDGGGAFVARETCRCFALVCAAPAPTDAGSQFLCRLATVGARRGLSVGARAHVPPPAERGANTCTQAPRALWCGTRATFKPLY